MRVAVCDQVEDPKRGQGAGPPRGHPRRHARHRDRRRPARSAQEQLPGGRRPGRSGRAWPGSRLSTGRFVAAGVCPRPAAGRPTGPHRARPSACWPRMPTPLPRSRSERMMVTRRPRWAFSQRQRRGQTWPSTSARPGWKASASTTARADAQAIRAAGAMLDYLDRNAEGLAGPHRPAVPLPQRQHAGDRRGEPPQPGNHPHDPRGPPRGVAAGRARPHASRRWARGCWPTGSPTRSDLDRGDRRPARRRRGTASAEPTCRRPPRRRCGKVYDVERLLARVTTGRASPRDLSFLGRTLALPSRHQGQD